MDISKLGSDRIQQDRVGTKDATQTQKSTASQAAENANVNNGAQATNVAKSNTSSNVKWSANAKLADEALAIAKNSPDVRPDKVAALKAAIANGTYKVDSKALADRMIEHSLQDDLLTR